MLLDNQIRKYVLHLGSLVCICYISTNLSGNVSAFAVYTNNTRVHEMVDVMDRFTLSAESKIYWVVTDNT